VITRYSLDWLIIELTVSKLLANQGVNNHSSIDLNYPKSIVKECTYGAIIRSNLNSVKQLSECLSLIRVNFGFTVDSIINIA
jgi:hypothetical protein